MKFVLVALLLLITFGVVSAHDVQIIGMGQSLSIQVTNIADQASLLTGGTVILNKYGVGGTEYAGLMPGTGPYISSLVNGGDVVDIIHGERDTAIGTTREAYAGYLHEWQAAYANDLGFDVPLVTDQVSSHGNTWQPNLVSQIALAQWDAARANDSIFLVGPKYQYPYKADRLHLTDEGNAWNGEQHGKVIAAVLSGNDWRPLEPDSVSINGRYVTIIFSVPVQPLQIDTTTVPERPFYGFEWEDVHGAQISTVTVGANRVILTLNQPTPGGVVRYAYTGTNQRGSRWGNIKDSDSTLSVSGNDLANWLVHFEWDTLQNKVYVPFFIDEE